MLRDTSRGGLNAKTNYTFVEIFDEEKKAGEMVLTEPFGMFEVGEKMSVLSKVTGLYCAELHVLLVDCRVGRISNDGEFMDVKSGISPTVQAHRNMSVTASVRDLPAYADDWHIYVKDRIMVTSGANAMTNARRNGENQYEAGEVAA